MNIKIYKSDHFSLRVNFGLCVLYEIAIAACDLAEVLGSAIALQLLFGIPLSLRVCITALNVFVLLLLQNKGFRYTEALVILLLASVKHFCFFSMSSQFIYTHLICEQTG